MTQHAYTLRKEYEGLDPDTTISLPEGGDYAVGQAFKDAPGGVIVLDDTNPDHISRIQTLAGYFAARTTTVPAPKPTTTTTVPKGG